MKFKRILTFLSALFCFNCGNQNTLVMNAIKNGSFSDIKDKTLTLSEVIFDDWAYPSLEKMKELFPDNKEAWDLGYMSLKYHGVKIIIEDLENMPYEYDETDDTYLYQEPDRYKFIAFFPRNNKRLENLFKKFYVSKDGIRIKGKFSFILPESVWMDTQIMEKDMPVMMIQSVGMF